MMTTEMTTVPLRTYYCHAFLFRIAFGESKMLRRCLLLLTLSFTVSATALFGRDLQTVSADTIILTVLLSPGEPPLQVTLRQMMDIYKDPGFSAAIIEHSRV